MIKYPHSLGFYSLVQIGGCMQGVENDNMNLLCLGGTLLSYATVKELIKLFLEATFTNQKKHVRRLQKILSLEHMISVADHNVGTKKNKSS